MRRLALFVVLSLFLAVVIRPPRSAAQSTRLCFDVPEITNCIEGRFREYWEQNGGLPVFGYPISAATEEQTPEGTFLTQYFERNRFELHPEKARPYDVLLGRLGDIRLKQAGRDWTTFPKAQPNAAHFFAETGHAVTHEPFWRYWSTHGLQDPALNAFNRSLALFGMPLSEPAMENNSSGDTVLTQWFERARLEDHGAKGVLLGLLGNETRLPLGVPILSHSSFTSGSSRYIVGELRNDTNRNIATTRIVANLYDAGGRLVGTEDGYAKCDIMKAGQRCPFVILIVNPPANFARYVLQVAWNGTDEQPLEGIRILTSGDRESGMGGSRYIFGEVRNDSDTPVKSVEIIATLYDGAGKVISVDSGSSTVEQLAPGETSPFQMLVSNWNNAVRYELQVEANRQ